MNYLIIGADGRSYGPVSAADLRQWIFEGRANAQSQVQAEGTTEWRPLGSFAEFAADVGAASLRLPPALPTISGGSGASTRTNGFAITGFILGLFSVPSFCCICATLPASALGLVFSCIALSQIKRNPMQGGKGLAVAGLVLSILGLLLWAAGFIFGMASALFDPTFLK